MQQPQATQELSSTTALRLFFTAIPYLPEFDVVSAAVPLSGKVCALAMRSDARPLCGLFGDASPNRLKRSRYLFINRVNDKRIILGSVRRFRDKITQPLSWRP